MMKDAWFDAFEDRFEQIFGFTLEYKFNYLSLGYALLFLLQALLYLLDAFHVLTSAHWGNNKTFNFGYVLVLMIYLLSLIVTFGFLMEPHKKRLVKIGAISMTVQVFGTMGYLVYAHFWTGNDKEIEYLFHYSHMMAPVSLLILITLGAITTSVMWKMSFFRSEMQFKEERYEEEERQSGSKKTA